MLHIMVFFVIIKLIKKKQEFIIVMNISLTPELEKLVQEKVNTGLYTSASEVIREALRLLFEQENIKRKRIQELNRDIQLGLDDLANNRVHDGKQVMEELLKRYQ